MNQDLAIRNVNSTVVTILYNDEGEGFEALDSSGNKVIVDLEKVATEQDKLEKEYSDQAWDRNRKTDYDALNQLELLTDDAANSTTTHAAAIAVIKTKWPKDNSGPVE
mgnify:FL=1|tara:strand:+ start:403 stop:726 length:324 start_codon:yes stop_codon:yes gene_type:complete